MHREAANVVRDEGCSAVEIADHYAHSGTAGDRGGERHPAPVRRGHGRLGPDTPADLNLRVLSTTGTGLGS